MDALDPAVVAVGRTAVVTGAASGLGLELTRLAVRAGMNVVMADVQADALDHAAALVRTDARAGVMALRVDVSRDEEVRALGAATLERFGVPHLVCNNAGVGLGGLVWEHSAADWAWVIGVNLMGVVHGVSVFTPLMLGAAREDPAYRGHIVNTASMAGLVNMPNMGAYSASKHAVVSLSETLYQDLALVTERVGVSVLCPYFVPTGIHRSERNRPSRTASPAAYTNSQRVARDMLDKAVESARVGAGEVARRVFEAVARRQFYVYSHPQALAAVRTRMEDLLDTRNPSDPFATRPDIGDRLRTALRRGD